MSDTKLTGFYFPWPNLGIKLSRQWANLRSNTEKEAPLIRAAYVDPQPSSANDPGNHDLAGWAIGERDFRNRFRVWYDKTNDRFSIQYNSGTEAVEVWDDYLSIRQVDGRVTVHGYGGLDSSAGGFYAPVPRNMAVSGNFFPAATEWVFEHNLGTSPILWNAFNLDDKSVVPQSVDVSNPNIAYFYFATAQSGRAIATAEAARGEGIRITDGTNVFESANRLSFNANDFYLSNEGHGMPVVNLQPIDLSESQHSTLAGLTADDHTQYVLADGTRAITGDQTFSSSVMVSDSVYAGSFYSRTFGEVAYANQGYLTVAEADGGPSFSTVNSLKFETASFYLTEDSSGMPIVNFRGSASGGSAQYGTGISSQEFSSSVEWQFNHGLGLQHIIWATYDDQGDAVLPGRVSTHDSNVTYFYFSPATAGRAVVAGGPLVNTIRVSETDGTPDSISASKVTFNSGDFYIELDSAGQPVVNFRGSSGGSGSSGVTDHGALTGLTDDDHTQYSLADGTRDFSGVVVGVTPTAASHLATKGYIDNRLSNFYGIFSAIAATDHGALTGLTDDDHSQYLLASDATNRATFAANWADLTDGGETSLHSHAASGSADGGFYGITWNDSRRVVRTDRLHFNGSHFYLDGSLPVLNIGSLPDGVVTFASLSQDAKDVTSDLALGLTMHDTSLTVTSDGATITATWADASTHGIHVLFGAGHTVVAAPGGSIATTLTAGTDASPQANYLYVLAATPTVLSVSTSGYPDHQTVEHSRVGYVLCQSAATLQTYGAYVADSTADHVHYENPAGTGHIAHINEWIKAQPATWKSGVAGTGTIVTGTTPDTVTFSTSSGVVFQGHPRTMPAIADPAGVFVVNHPSGAYTRVTTMPGLTSGGSAIGGGDRIIVVLWGVINDNSGDCKLFLNLPSGYYGANAAAIADDSKYANYTIPSAFKGTGFLISSFIYTYTTTSGGTYTLLQQNDLRGQFPSSFPGGSTAANTEFVDSTFRINDNSDATKQIAFEASGITASTTRTLTVQDRSGTIALTDQLGGFYGVYFKDGVHSYRDDLINFNPSHFYLSETAQSKPMLNLRYDEDTLQLYAESVAVGNFFIDCDAPYDYVIQDASLMLQSGTCSAAFYIVGAGLNNNGVSVTGLDPLSVTSTKQVATATAERTVSRGQQVKVSVFAVNAGKQLRVSMRARKPS